MKILVVSPFFPYKSVPHAGGSYIFDFITGLSKEHEIHLVSRIEPGEQRYASEMKSLCKNVLLYPFKTPEKRSLLGTLSIVFSYFTLGRMARRYLREGDFDLVQVEYVETAIMLSKIKKCSSLLDAHDIISKPAERRYRLATTSVTKISSFILWKILKKVEAWAASRFDLVITRSDMDRKYLLGMAPSVSAHVIPHPLKSIKNRNDNDRESPGLNILFAGAMNRKVNQDAVIFIVEKILPAVKAQLPDVKLLVVGNNPPQKIREYGEKDKQVIVTGFVDNIMEYYLDAAVLVTPLFIGGGIIAKNIDAMGVGLPVITSHIGNEGICAVDGESVLIANTEEEFSSMILKVLSNPGFAKKISDGGREFALQRFAPPVIMGLIEDSLKRAMAGKA